MARVPPESSPERTTTGLEPGPRTDHCRHPPRGPSIKPVAAAQRERKAAKNLWSRHRSIAQARHDPRRHSSAWCSLRRIRVALLLAWNDVDARSRLGRLPLPQCACIFIDDGLLLNGICCIQEPPHWHADLLARPHPRCSTTASRSARCRSWPRSS